MSHKIIKDRKDTEENIGVETYLLFGKIFIGCGIAWLLLTLAISFLPQDYEKYNIPLFFSSFIAIGMVVLLIGITLIMLCRKLVKFQKWAEKDVQKAGYKLYMKEKKREEKSKKFKI